jgi:hypothetical protein
MTRTIFIPDLQDPFYRLAGWNSDEFGAHIKAESASARCGPAPVRSEAGDDDELAEPAPQAGPRRRGPIEG